MHGMKRREFVTLLGGAAAAWPLAARAQQHEYVRRVGVLNYLAADDPDSSPRVAAFAQALQGLGWLDGRNIQIDYRWGGVVTRPMRKTEIFTVLRAGLASPIARYSSGARIAEQ
jgi:hypothetical protein